MTHPDGTDVVIRQERSDSATVFLLGTVQTPDQFITRTRDEAVTQALRYARRQHVRAWFARGGDDFVLLGTFREERAESIRAS